MFENLKGEKVLLDIFKIHCIVSFLIMIDVHTISIIVSAHYRGLILIWYALCKKKISQ